MPICLGFDTSNYTTSAAVFDGGSGCNVGRLLEVPQGMLGLRQSDALFQHVKRLPELVHRLREEGELDGEIAAVGASTRPREVDGSYMPCFLAGADQGQVIADVLGVPFFACSHQQGHIAAAAWSSGRIDLLDRPHFAWHLSGGTTELLYVEPEGSNVRATCIGGTSDISAGQLIDRTGVLLDQQFPAGKAIDALSGKAEKDMCFTVKIREGRFSLSGMENKVKDLVGAGEKPENIARFVLNTIASVLVRVTDQVREQYPDIPVLCSGGVASNRLIRERLTQTADAVFAPSRYSTDNALGVAVLTYRALKGGGSHAGISRI